jgi:hypothetical protein
MELRSNDRTKVEDMGLKRTLSSTTEAFVSCDKAPFNLAPKSASTMVNRYGWVMGGI